MLRQELVEHPVKVEHAAFQHYSLARAVDLQVQIHLPLAAPMKAAAAYHQIRVFALTPVKGEL